MKDLPLRAPTGCGVYGATKWRHSAYVCSVTYMPGTAHLVCGTYDGEVVLWDDNGHRQKSWQCGEEPILALAANSHLIVAGSQSGAVFLLSPASYELTIQSVTHRDGVIAVAFIDDDGTFLTVGAEGNAWRWQFAPEIPTLTSELILSIDRDIDAVGIADSRRRFAFVSCEELWTLDLKTATLRNCGKCPPVWSCCYVTTPREAVVLGSRIHEQTEVVDLTTGERNVVAGSALRAMTLSPDGRILVGAARNELHVIEVAKLDTSRVYATRNGVPETISFRDDGNKIAISGPEHIPFIHDSAGYQWQNCDDEHRDLIDCVGFGPNGTVLSAGADRIVRVHNTTRPSELRELEFLSYNVVGGVDFDVNGERVLVSLGRPESHVIELWDLRSGSRIWRTCDLEELVGGVVFGPNRELFLAHGQSTLLVFRVKDGRQVARIESGDFTIAHAEIHPNGDRILSCNSWYDLYEWTFEGECRQIELGPLRGVSLFAATGSSSDPRLVCVDADCGEIGVVSLATEQVTKLGCYALGNEMTALAVDPHGSYAVIGTRSGDILLYDLASSGTPVRWRAHQGRVSALAFDAAGKRLASGSFDTTVVVWDTTYCRGAET